MALSYKNKNPKQLRVIKTARDKESINDAVRNGFQALIKKIEPSDKISAKYAVIQHKQTREIRIISDYRMKFLVDEDGDFELIIDWTYHYPYNFKSPFAAYLIPKDISVGERVFIEDLIEDYVGVSWNQGDTFRLESCEAIWNGTDLEIQYEPTINQTKIIG